MGKGFWGFGAKQLVSVFISAVEYDAWKSGDPHCSGGELLRHRQGRHGISSEGQGLFTAVRLSF